MNSQEELAGCLQQIMDAVAPDTRRLSIVRDGDKPRVDRAQERHVGRYQDVTTAAIHALARPGGVRGVRR
jgi:hypothetical protein